VNSPDASILNAIRDLKGRRAAIDRAIEALEALTDLGNTAVHVLDKPEANGSTSRRGRRSDGAGGLAGVERVLRERPNQGLHQSELADAMIANGWETDAEDPARAARASANRLRRANPDEFELVGGKFYFRPRKTAGESGVQTRFDPQESPPGR
jgi:hypothetical protein